MPDRDAIADISPFRAPATRGDNVAGAGIAAGPFSENRIERLIERLPRRSRAPVRWLRQPSSRWARIPTGVLLVGGGVFSILPLLGLWMLPLGLMLLAEDMPPLRRGRDHLLDWVERRRPHWFAEERRVTLLDPPQGLGRPVSPPSVNRHEEGQS